MTKVFSTGQAAKLCGVCIETVKKWFDSGQLKGYRFPGSKVRRIPRIYLQLFLKEQGLRSKELEDQTTAKILLVSQDKTLIQNLVGEMPLAFNHAFQVVASQSSFNAGIQYANLLPDCIVVDLCIGRFEAMRLCQSVSNRLDVILITIHPDDGSSSMFGASATRDSFRKPVTVKLLVNRIKALIGAKKDLD